MRFTSKVYICIVSDEVTTSLLIKSYVFELVNSWKIELKSPSSLILVRFQANLQKEVYISNYFDTFCNQCRVTMSLGNKNETGNCIESIMGHTFLAEQSARIVQTLFLY